MVQRRFLLLVVLFALMSALPVLGQDSSGVRLIRFLVCPSEGISAAGIAVVAEGSYAYVSLGGEGFSIIDIQDPRHPREVGHYDSPDYVSRLAKVGRYVYVADMLEGLRIVDVRDPEHPSESGFYLTQREALSVCVEGSNAYVTEIMGGIVIVDISNPMQPQEVGYFETESFDSRMTISGNYAYVADGEAGLRIFSLVDPVRPQEIGSYTAEGFYGVAVVEANAYLAVIGDGLHIIDIRDPEQPIVIGSLNVPGTPQNVTVFGSHAFLANEVEGLRIVDLSYPTEPVEVGWYAPWWIVALDVAAEKHYVYVAGSPSFCVLDWSGVMSAPPDPNNPYPSSFFLYPCFPNPFNSTTTIAFDLPQPGNVCMAVIDPLGRLVQELTPMGWMTTGKHSVVWDAEGTASGVYWLNINVNGLHIVRKMVKLQ
jgi:hypothetical protein